MNLSEFDFHLPRQLIAQTPVQKRDQCRLMVVRRQSATIQHDNFSNIAHYLDDPDGEYWFEKKGTGGTLHLILPQGQNPNTARVEAGKAAVQPPALVSPFPAPIEPAEAPALPTAVNQPTAFG